jgi:hypothetical protein
MIRPFIYYIAFAFALSNSKLWITLALFLAIEKSLALPRQAPTLREVSMSDSGSSFPCIGTVMKAFVNNDFPFGVFNLPPFHTG